MKVPIINIASTETGKIDLPEQFSEPVRTDLVKKAVVAINANSRQPYGGDPDAGKRASAKLSRRRKDYKGAYGIGISRVPRKILSRRGTRMNWVAAFAPGTVKGRRAHPPKAIKEWSMKINKKENRKAIRSAMSATMIKELVRQCGHIIPEKYPFVVDNQLESLDKAKDVMQALEKMGFAKELERISEKKVRPGRGTMRGRRYRKKVGPLLVVSDKCKLLQSARNLAGVDVIKVDKLNARALTSGIKVGRLTIYTQGAVEKIAKQSLFTDKVKNGSS
jgi:large subunit ribosomal protein L4e